MRLPTLVALLALTGGPAAAQVVVGGAKPSVEVDLSAIYGSRAPATGSVVPGYDRPLLIPPVERPKLTPPASKSAKRAPAAAAATPASPPPPKSRARPSPTPAPPPAVAASPPAAAAPSPPKPPSPPPYPPAPEPSGRAETVASAPPNPPPAASPRVFSPSGPSADAPPPQAFQPAAPRASQPEPRRAKAPPAPEPERPVQTASLPPAGGDLSLEFKADSADLSRAAQDRLRALAARLKSNEDRLQLKAYASGGSDGASRARRISLSRALAVRAFLIDQGLRSTRIDVRALGQVRDGGPEDRVDVTVLAQ